jgi:hypothetical protein
MRREKTLISKIRNAKVDIITNITEIQEIIRDYFENIYSNKFQNLEEIDRFLDTYVHPKEDINHQNRSITQNEIEAAIVSRERKVQDLMDSQLNSIRPLKKTEYQPSLNSSMK